MNKKIISLLLALVMVLPMVAVAETESVQKNATIEIHVSPSGMSNGKGTVDSPYDSMATVKNKLLEVKYNNPKSPIDVIFHEGEYRFTEKITFSSEYSGTKEAPITFKAAEGEGRPIFKGSKKLDLSKLKRVTDPATLLRIPADARNNVIMIDLAEQGVTNFWDYQLVSYANEGKNNVMSTIYFNGRGQIRARYPNGINQFKNVVSITDAGKQRTRGKGATYVIDTYRLMNWTTATDAFYVGFPSRDYFFERLKIEKFNPATKEISNLDGSHEAHGMWLTYSGRWAIENLLEELDVPGEYYIDRVNKILYYYPEDTLLDATLEISYLNDHLMWFEDVSYVGFEGIEFAQMLGFAFRAAGRCDGFTVRDCIFREFGYMAFGIDIPKGGTALLSKRNAETSFENGGSMGIIIENNAFYHGAVEAFKITVGSRDENIHSGSVIKNNYIYNMGTYSPNARGIQTTGVGVDILNNSVHYTGHGISYTGAEMNIGYNEIGNAMANLADGAAIYTGRTFVNRGSEVHHNFIHDTFKRGTGMTHSMAYGIYMDDMQSGDKIYNNIVANASGGVVLNGGYSLTSENNIFYNCDVYGNYIKMAGPAAYKNSFVNQLEDAITKFPAYDKYPDIKADYEAALKWFPNVANLVVVNNVATFDNSTKFTDAAKARNNVLERPHIVTDADHVDPANYDFRLKADSEFAKLLPDVPSELNTEKMIYGADKTKFKYPLEIGEEFRLIYPKNGTRALPTGTVEFAWQRPIGADKFTVIIATDPEMKNIVKQEETWETTKIVEGLELGKTYYWKVKAKCLMQIGDLMEWESAGVPHMFTIAQKEAADTTDLLGAIAKGEDLYDKIQEGTELGKYKIGVKAALKEQIDKARTLLSKRDRTKEDIVLVSTNIEAIVNDDSLVNGGSVNVGDLIADKERWISNEVDGQPHHKFTEDGGIELFGGTGANNDKVGGHATYTGIKDYSRLMIVSARIKAIYPDETDSSLFALGLRSQQGTSHPWYAGNEQYYFILKEGKIEYQRNSSTGNQLMQTVETPLSKANEWMDIDMGVINLGIGQYVFLRIDGQMIFEAFDTSNKQIHKKGGFQMSAATNVRVFIQPAQTELLDFDKVVKEKTEEMTLEYCKTIHKLNNDDTGVESDMLLFGQNAKKAYYNYKLYDIEYPAYANGDNIMIPLTSFAKVTGASISGNTITFNSRTITFTEGSLIALVNGATYNLSVKPEVNNGNLCVSTLDLASMIDYKGYNNGNKMALMATPYSIHAANQPEEFTNAQNALMLYK